MIVILIVTTSNIRMKNNDIDNDDKNNAQDKDDKAQLKNRVYENYHC